MYEKSEMRAVMGDITDTVVPNMEYEASIKVHQGREPNMYRKPEMGEIMIKTNPSGKHDEANVVGEGQCEARAVRTASEGPRVQAHW